MNESGQITGGAFVPNGVWPIEYDGAYVYADYGLNKLYLIQQTDKEPCLDCNPPKSNQNVTDFTTLKRVLNLAFGPYNGTQALYWSNATGAINRIVYAGNGNRAPTAVATADPTEGVANLTVEFDGSKSTDPDGDTLIYQWDFNVTTNATTTPANATNTTTLAKPSFTYTANGVYVATLTVSDGRGGNSTTTIDISVGTRPAILIASPAENYTFAVGDNITLSANVTDGANATLSGKSLTWEVRFHQDDSYLLFLEETTGNNIKLPPAPKPKDYPSAQTSFLEIILTATDKDGLSTTVTREISPTIVTVDLETIPSGLSLVLDGTRIETPVTAISWENHELEVQAPNQTLDGQAYIWSSWSTGENISDINITIPKASPDDAIVANFTELNGTLAPATMAPTVCLPGSFGLVADGDPLLSDEYLENYDFNAFVHQSFDGNLVVKRGTISKPGAFIWESGYAGQVGFYHTVIQRDGNMITYQGTPESRGPIVWQTGTVDIEGDHFLGIDCAGEIVSVYQGRPNNPGDAVWPVNDMGPGVPPTAAPTDMAGGPSTGVTLNTLLGLSLPLALADWLLR